ncbi:hypothetical protein [Nostocoides sp. Soil756]|jgi:hypothetical protein|uniref:hypothetical protein n=1 Tax=Nostocoides sp. Soil756 TaxID=1736399 RepID=UPI0006F50B03|nr:hypothetical protein [Tetrasphaera sp. Soil756]KRE60152.1 hypothetical protein ASG78_15760 [Tetrasphaera sp. Soil756]
MTAVVGGLWDSPLGEGSKCRITATSDSHVHLTRGGFDFGSGEYSKTYVSARQDYADVMDGLRTGRIFVATGDLVTSLDVSVSHAGRPATVGETVTVKRGRNNDVEVRMCCRPPRVAVGRPVVLLQPGVRRRRPTSLTRRPPAALRQPAARGAG